MTPKQAADLLVRTYTQQVFTIRHQRQPRLDTTLGCRLGTAIPSEALSKVLSDTFNTVCVPLTWAGPCGAPAALWQRPVPVVRSTATPPTVTFTAGADPWIVTHGEGVPEGSVNEHPLMSIVSLESTAGFPPTFTFVFVVVIVAWPPCGQTTVHPVSRIVALTSTPPGPSR